MVPSQNMRRQGLARADSSDSNGRTRWWEPDPTGILANSLRREQPAIHLNNVITHSYSNREHHCTIRVLLDGEWMTFVGVAKRKKNQKKAAKGAERQLQRRLRGREVPRSDW